MDWNVLFSSQANSQPVQGQADPKAAAPGFARHFKERLEGMIGEATVSTPAAGPAKSVGLDEMGEELRSLFQALYDKKSRTEEEEETLDVICLRLEQWHALRYRTTVSGQQDVHNQPLDPEGIEQLANNGKRLNVFRDVTMAFEKGDPDAFLHRMVEELPYLVEGISAEDMNTEETIKSSVVEVLRNFLQQMRVHPSKSISKTFSMNPEQLGKMTVQYTAESGEPVLDIKVENKAAFTLLKPLQADIRTQLPLNQLSLTLAEGNRAAGSDVRTEGEYKPAAMTVSQDLSKRVVKVLERVTDGRQAPPPQSTTLAVRNAVVAQQQLGLYETGNRSGEQKALGMAIRSKEALDPWTAPSASIPLLQKEAAARIDGNADKAAFQVLRMSEQPAFPLAETKTSGQEMKQWVKDLEQFVQKSRMLTDLHGNKELRIQMKPGNLGDLTVKVAQINGEMVVKLMVGSQSAKEVIEGNLHHLRHVFSPHQVVVERTDTPAGGLAYQESKEQEESGSKRNGQGSSPDRERDDTEEDGPTFEELLRMNEKV
ncbi:UNVERIFIED_CONTAM: flagellar hook-length control protein FliK [Halobacillus marinus]